MTPLENLDFPTLFEMADLLPDACSQVIGVPKVQVVSYRTGRRKPPPSVMENMRDLVALRERIDGRNYRGDE